MRGFVGYNWSDSSDSRVAHYTKLDAGGGVIAGAELLGTESWASASSGDDGRYSLCVHPGNDYVRVSAAPPRITGRSAYSGCS